MNPDDPKLTAYALDELDPAERAEIEQLLRDDPDALRELEETTAFAAQLRRELQAEPAAPLEEVQRAMVLDAMVPQASEFRLAPHPSVPPATWGQRWFPLAASIAIVAGVTALVLNNAVQQEATRSIQDRTALTAQIDGLVVTPPGVDEKRGAPVLAARPTNGSFTTGDLSGATGEFKAREIVLENEGVVISATPPPSVAADDALTSFGAPLSIPQTSPHPPLSASGSLVSGGLPMYQSVDEFASAKPMTSPVDPAFADASAVVEPTLAGSLVPQKSAEAPLIAGTTSGGYISEAQVARETPRSKATGTAIGPSRAIAQANPGPRFRNPVNEFQNYPPGTRVAGGDIAGGKKSLEQSTPESSGAQPSLAYANAAVSARATPAAAAAPRSNGATYAMAKEERRDSALVPKIPDVSGFVNQEKELNSLSAGVLNTETYDAITDNAFLPVQASPLSTFSIDVDTASYANVRRFLSMQTPPPKNAVRIEELLNYFPYDYPQPEGDAPFSATMEVATCPWAPEHRLVRVGLKGREIQAESRPASNLVFLLDVSGSMSPENRLPLLKKCLAMMVEHLSAEDTVSIAVYAGASGTVLNPSHDKREILAALDRLQSGGSTNGAAGIKLAYRLAEQSFIKGGVNRVILATDGDFNVGVTSQSELTDLIERKAKSGVFLTVLGVGMGNLKDSTLEKLADRGNGNYAYIDTINEGRKVLVEQMSGTLITIAKDVKIQVEFNPAQASSYRLIGYENRLMAKEDFNNDQKDAGEIGAGHTVTALYEVVPTGAGGQGSPAVDPLKYQPSTESKSNPLLGFNTPEDSLAYIQETIQTAEQAEAAGKATEALRLQEKVVVQLSVITARWPEWNPSLISSRKDHAIQAAKRLIDAGGTLNPPAATPASKELLTLKLRYKQPDGDKSKLIEFPLTDRGETWEKSSRDFRFAASVASFGMLLRDSTHKGTATWETVRELAMEGRGEDRSGYRAEFITLIEQAKAVRR